MPTPSGRAAAPTAVRALLAMIVVAAPTLIPEGAAGQESTRVEATPSVVSVQPVEGRGEWWTLWSRPSTHDRFIVGMSSFHIFYAGNGWANNQALGIVAKGLFGATYINTYQDRGWTAGFERSWLEGRKGPFTGMIGFRAGLMYGYGEDLGWLAEYVPVLPFAQPVLMGRLGPLTVDFTYTWVVLSFTGGVAVW